MLPVSWQTAALSSCPSAQVELMRLRRLTRVSYLWSLHASRLATPAFILLSFRTRRLSRSRRVQMATKENVPLRIAKLATEPPTKRRKLSPPQTDIEVDAPMPSQPESLPPPTQSQSQTQSQKKSQSQGASQTQPSFADVLARLKETTSGNRGTRSFAHARLVPRCFLLECSL
jgi:hypothetical protein